MANTLSDFKGALVGGGARPNLFRVEIPNIGLTDDDHMMIKAAQLPESTIGLIEIPFRGRNFKVAGDRTFAAWTVTVINDEQMKVRKAIEKWMQDIAQYEDGSGKTQPSDYMKTATVTQLLRSSTNLAQSSGQGLKDGKSYTFKDIFPTNLGAIDLSYDSSDTIEEFTAEFQVNYWEPNDLGGSGTSVSINLSATLGE